MGNIEHRIPVTGAVELAELAQAFNVMMDRVQEKAAESKAYEDELAELNATLEQQVHERTLALEESETQYRTLVEHSPDSILIVQEGRVRFVNRAFEETFGINESTALAPTFSLEALFEESSAELVAGLLEAWQAGEATGPVMVSARDTNGSLHELEIRGSHIEYRGRTAAECLLVDMTEAKRLREELEDTERLRALGELSSGVAHDFNNLLGAILGRIQLLRDREFTDDIDREMAVIEKAARDGRETVRRIQEFSRTRADRPFAAVHLPDILRDAVEITRTRWESDAQRRNITIQTSEDYGDVPPIQGNATELREVFTNLILNAVDAMPEGGEVRLRCRLVEGRVRAEVGDSGVGMTEEIRRHLFDPFFTTKCLGGTGLGMSVAYGIVTRHQGTIDVTSSLGYGTTFTLEFPPCTGEVVRHGEVAAAPRLGRPGRILVIDDEPPIAELLGDALSGEGHRVELAGSGQEGVRKAQGAEFDLVLTDLGMPDMSGWEVVHRIHADTPELPVVLVTGWGSTISEEEAERGGVAAVVHKPFEIKDLLHTTTTILSQSLSERREGGEPDGGASA
jgi:PAS domain S-box-containing protein